METGPFVQHHEAVAILSTLELSIHHLIAWLLEVYQLKNWSIGQQIGRHLPQAAADLEDSSATKQPFIYLLLILLQGVRLSALRFFSKPSLAPRHFHATRYAHYLFSFLIIVFFRQALVGEVINEVVVHSNLDISSIEH